MNKTNIQIVILTILIFTVGFICGFIIKENLIKHHYKFFAGKLFGGKYSYGQLNKIEVLNKELSLSEEQQVKIISLLSQHKKTISEIMKDVDPKVKMQMHYLQENIRSSLDDAQRDKYNDILRKHQRKNKERNAIRFAEKQQEPQPQTAQQFPHENSHDKPQ